MVSIRFQSSFPYSFFPESLQKLIDQILCQRQREYTRRTIIFHIHSIFPLNAGNACGPLRGLAPISYMPREAKSWFSTDGCDAEGAGKPPPRVASPAAPPESFTAASREAQLLCGRPLHYCSSCSTP